MTKATLSGYKMRNEATRAINANRMASQALRRILHEEPSPHGQAVLLAKTASALAENLDALIEINTIIQLAGATPVEKRQ